MKKLIIHADDFNLTFGINLGIIKAFKEGIVRSASIMINLPGIEHSISLLRENPKLDIGLHVNLTFGEPILNPRKVLSLIDQEGFFYRKINLLMQKACALEIEKEIIAQVKKARNLKLNISHLDSHHHLHKEKEVMEIFKKIAQKEGLALRANNLKMKSFFKDIKTPDYFIEEFYGKEKVTLKNFKSILNHLKDGATEICAHPGFYDSGISKISSYNLMREKELDILTHPEIKKLIGKLGIKLISFKDL